MQEKYVPKEAEPRLAQYWEEQKVYKFPTGEGEIYAIDTPPPTISGFIHVGHVFSYSQADFMARYKRMRGFRVFYPFGLDNNGLPTEMLVEKQNNTTAEKVGREKFIELVETSIKEYEQMYVRIWKSVGVSVDWSFFYTTISKEVQRISQYSFLELNRMGRVYRRETPTIWCAKEGTSLSQMELEDKLLKSKFVTLKFSPEVMIATTRPEMLPACVAIFVNPDDKKHAKLVGKKVKVPLFGQEVTIMTDRRVDPEKGTGIVMCCTFGDLTDIEWYKAYNLPLRIIIDNHGRMLDPHFKGMKIKEARAAVIEELKQKGYLTEEKEIEHNVNVHERCKTEIEFLVTKQWYIRYLDMKEKLLELGNRLNWTPPHMKVRYENWVKGLQWDWSISRQRYYGIPFPVWYCGKCDEPVFAEKAELPVNPLSSKPKGACPKCGSGEFAPEKDVLDTWATSSLTPLINARWGLPGERMEVFPMALRPQAHDIISFWLFTTVVKSYLHTGKLPWKDVMISGHGLDQHGKPMHKSVGNTVDPIPVIEKYGADALRYWASSSKLGEDASFQEKDIITGARIVNKLWNVARFVAANPAKGAETTNIIDRWILARAMQTVKEATVEFDAYNYAGAKRIIEQFFWLFCDNYLEFIKYRIYNNDASANHTLNAAFNILLKLFAPFMPYVTEEAYLELYAEKEGKKSVHVSEWPAFDKKLADERSMKEGDVLCGIISTVRAWKHDNKMALNADLSELVLSELPKEGLEDIRGAMKIKKVVKGAGEMAVPETELKLSVKR